MRFSLIFVFILLFSSTAYTQTIPEELQKAGFTQYNLISYSKEGTQEFFTFSDWTTERAGDTITFVVENGINPDDNSTTGALAPGITIFGGRVSENLMVPTVIDSMPGTLVAFVTHEGSEIPAIGLG